MTTEEFKRRLAVLVDQFVEGATDEARRTLIASLGGAVSNSSLRSWTKSAQAVALREQGKSYAEIATALDSTVGSIGALLSRARKLNGATP